MSEEDEVLADSVVASVLNYTGVSYNNLIHRRNMREAVAARRVISLILREYDWSYPKIGEVIKKDHSSVYNLVNRASTNVVAEAHNLKDRIVYGDKRVKELTPNRSWKNSAACKDSPTELFFNVEHKKKALAMCNKCLVQVECLDYRFETLNAPDEDSGIWGNTTPAQRSRMKT